MYHKELYIPCGNGKYAFLPFPMTEKDFEMMLLTLELWKCRLIKNTTIWTDGTWIP